MALTNRSLFLYGFQVTANNSSLDFRAVSGGPILMASLTVGFYSLTGLAAEITRAMKAIDPTRDYTVTVNRNVGGGLQNRVTIFTSGTYFQLLFGSGPRVGSSISSLIGFLASDYVGNITYMGATTAGTTLLPTYIGYSYLPPEADHKVFGAVNIAANGDKESVVFQIQKFITVDFQHEAHAAVKGAWVNLIDWLIQQRLFEFTPDITYPNTFYEVTLEKSQADGKGLGWRWTEELPSKPFMYRTGTLTFRVKPPVTSFI